MTQPDRLVQIEASLTGIFTLEIRLHPAEAMEDIVNTLGPDHTTL